MGRLAHPDAETRAPADGVPSSDQGSSDHDLIHRTKSGNSAAFAELWRRHSAKGLAFAKSFTTFDADDIVAESFARIFQAIRDGGGPTGAFRPYLLTTIRNLAIDMSRKGVEMRLGDGGAVPDPRFTDERALAAFDRSTTAVAFTALESRWQEVLWYAEVERLSHGEIALVLGITANAVSALAFRARSAFRERWVQAHLQKNTAGPECQWTVERLGAYTRGSLLPRASARVQLHFGSCAPCRSAQDEAANANSRLALVLLPLLLGVSGAAAWAALQPVSAATAAALPATSIGHRVISRAAQNAARLAVASPGVAIAAAAAGILLLGAIVVFVPAWASESTPHTTQALPAAAAPPTPNLQPKPTATPALEQPTVPSATDNGLDTVADVHTAPSIAAAILAPLDGSVTNSSAVTLTGVGTPGSDLTLTAAGLRTRVSGPTVVAQVPSDGRWNATLDFSALPDDDYGIELGPSGGSAHAVTHITVDRQVAPPAAQADTGNNLLLPILSGTSEPFATIRITIDSVPPGETVTLRAAADGSWRSTTLTAVPLGSSSLTVTQTDSAGNVSPPALLRFTLKSPALFTELAPFGYIAQAQGQPGATAEFTLDGGASVLVQLDASGTRAAYLPWSAPPGGFDVAVRYRLGDRFGPTAHQTVLWARP